MNSNQVLTKSNPPSALNEQLKQIAIIADSVAARHAFSDYRSRRAHNTIERQDDDLNCFALYLKQVGVKAGELSTDPAAWRGLTFGFVEGFTRWMLQQGISIGTINVRLSTVKVYCRLAAKSGAITPDALALILTVKGYRHAEGKRIDSSRPLTRQGAKKEEATPISRDQARRLRAKRSTPQGRRDAVLMGLLLDLGLRVGEICRLPVTSVDLQSGTITFYRPKVDKVQTHALPRSLLSALKSYFACGDAPAAGPLLRRSIKNERLGKAGLTRNGVFKRVRELGLAVGISTLSPHDCRHYWATQAARHKTPIDRLQDGGGWSSPAMPLRYVESASIANEGILLGEESEQE